MENLVSILEKFDVNGLEKGKIEKLKELKKWIKYKKYTIISYSN